MTTGIYGIFNKTNGKCYIGSSKDISTRWSGHRGQLRAGRHHSICLQRAYDKYGKDSFAFCIIELVCESDLIRCEQEWIDRLNTVAPNGYNVSPRSDRPIGSKGYKLSNEQKAAKRAYRHTQEARELIRQAGLGRVFSQQAKDKIAAANRAREVPQERRDKIASSLIGKVQSDETKAKRAEAHRELWADPSKRASILEKRKRSNYTTDEYRAKLSASIKAAWADPEKRAKMLAARIKPQATK